MDDKNCIGCEKENVCGYRHNNHYCTKNMEVGKKIMSMKTLEREILAEAIIATKKKSLKMKDILAN